MNDGDRNGCCPAHRAPQRTPRSAPQTVVRLRVRRARRSLFLCAVIVLPLGHAFWTSLHRVRGLDTTFVGSQNYARVLGRRGVLAFARRFARIHRRVCVALHMLLGLALALLLHALRFARTALRILFLTPWMVAPAVGATIWLWLLEPQFGVVNYLLRAAGI